MSGALSRIGRNWRALSSEQRLAAIAAFALLLSMLLPWYDETVVNNGKIEHVSKTAFGVYSFVEAAIFVVVVGVLVLLWARAERKAFHLPGDWGIFIAFLLGAWLAYAGYRIRASHVPEPVVDDAPPPAAQSVPAPAAAEPPPAEAGTPETEPSVVARRRRAPDDDALDGQLSFDEPAEYRPPPRRG
jgi:hypothetical protein